MAVKTICDFALSYATKLFHQKENSVGKWRCQCGSGYCKLTVNQLLKSGLTPKEGVKFYLIQVTGKPAEVVKPTSVSKADVKPLLKASIPPQLLVVDNETLNLVNSVEYPLEGFTHHPKLLLQGALTVHKVFLLLKQLGYNPVLATSKSVMDVGLASDIAIQWKGGWRLMQVKSSIKYAKIHFEKKGDGFQLHSRISKLLPGIDPKKRWDCPECLIIVNGRLVCLNANGRGSYFPPALRADDYVVEKYNW